LHPPARPSARAGTEELEAKLRRLKELRHLPAYSLVEREIQGFGASLPLMRELKSDALRCGGGAGAGLLFWLPPGMACPPDYAQRTQDGLIGADAAPSRVSHPPARPPVTRRKRHWQQLMAVTGQSFELDVHTFTLGNMFAMQLHRFAADISRITSAALKELTIEGELKKMAEVWREQRFVVHKYSKVGGCRRPAGVLGALPALSPQVALDCSAHAANDTCLALPTDAHHLCHPPTHPTPTPLAPSERRGPRLGAQGH
jgi:hypothetical protein